jgi:hypothetical protein
VTTGRKTDSKPLRTEQEKQVAEGLAGLFEANADPLETRLASWTKYVRRQDMTRFLALYEIFKRIIPVKGSIVECGVNRGYGLMAWAKLSAVLEPVNLTRRIYGFDSFAGFPSIGEGDRTGPNWETAKAGALHADSYDELLKLVDLYDKDRFLGHIPKVELIKGDATQTIPRFMADHPHLVVSLLFMDFDLHEPTKAALQSFVPRMPKGAILAFDELDNPLWPGETLALLETLGINRLELERLDFDPYIAFARIS